MSRLPVPGQDVGTWGPILVDFLNQAHNPDGTLKTSVVSQIVSFTSDGTVVSGTGTKRFVMPGSGTIGSVYASIDTSPGGQNIIVDVRKNGTSVFLPSNRPTINAGSNVSNTSIPDTPSFVTGDYFTVDTSQIGTSPVGANMVVQLLVTFS